MTYTTSSIRGFGWGLFFVLLLGLAVGCSASLDTDSLRVGSDGSTVVDASPSHDTSVSDGTVEQDSAPVVDAGITVTTPTDVLTVSEIGTTASFTIVLDSVPTSNVTIALSSSDVGEGTTNQTSVIFTPSNWSTAQTVTVTGVDDAETDGNQTYTIVTAAAQSNDTDYNGINPADVTVTTTDNETPGVTVTVATPFETTEGEGAESFTVVLNTPPNGDVTITLTITGDDTGEGLLSTGSGGGSGTLQLSFDQDNWSTAQTVNVTPVDDSVIDGDVTYTIQTTAASGTDTDYDGIAVDDVTVTNNDDDSAGVVLSQSPVNVSEDDAAATTFTFRLASQPAASVTVTLDTGSTDQATVSPSTPIAFTTENWDAPVTITVTPVDDSVDDDNGSFTITFNGTSEGDDDYDVGNLGRVTVTVEDNDDPNVIVVTPTTLTTQEGGSAQTFEVSLSSAPTGGATVTVTVAKSGANSDEGTVSPTTLTFNGENLWNEAQTVTVTPVDDDEEDGAKSYTVTTTGAGVGSGYDGVTGTAVTVTNNDDSDVAGISVAPPTGGTDENGATDTFTVTLDTKPTSSVTIDVTSNIPTEGVVSVGTSCVLQDSCALVFASDNNDWQNGLTFTVTGVPDATANGDMTYDVILDVDNATSADEYDDESTSVSVTNVDVD